MADPRCNPPLTSTFSFTAPFPVASTSSSSSSGSASSLKQRRVSLALPSSPKLVSPWSFRDDTELESHAAKSSNLVPERKGKMRRIANDSDREEAEGLIIMEKRQRKKWTPEETQMLVDGCNIWGVGNWKAILKDPTLKFDNRSPVDLKDRFRTYFPDAYKEHYPNAKTHLSSKVRSTLPDGRSIFEKTRSKRRRPFTEEEDRALKAGYEKHGTVWALIAKDPIFQEQNRRSTDLRDRFRNAFPELYRAAGYKPRNTVKKKRDCLAQLPVRAATDDQIPTSSNDINPPRRVQTAQSLYRGGTKSVPESPTCSEDEESSGGEEENDRLFKSPAVPSNLVEDSQQQDQTASVSDAFAEVTMDTIDTLSEPLIIPDYMPSSTQSLSDLTTSSQQQWSSSGLETPVNSASWSVATGSPSSSHLSSEFHSQSQSPFNRRSDGVNMIGKSAWGTQDWFSANPRLDPSGVSSSGSSFAGGVSPSPSSPFSFHNLNHGVLDRYDLFPTSFAHDFASEAGVGETHSTFSDPDMFASSSFRGFTHHSNYAGDLIFGARSHQPQQSFYGPGFGFGVPALGLSGMQQSTGIHPMQLHTPALPGIDEIELASINLNDQSDPSHDAMESAIEQELQKDEPELPLNLVNLDLFNLPSDNLEDIVDLPSEMHSTPPATPSTTSRPLRGQSNMHSLAMHGRSISVPPSEMRSVPRPPLLQATHSHPHISASDPLMSHTHNTTHSHTAQGHAGMSLESNLTDAWRSSNLHDDLYDLPFLDLHYFNNSNSNYAGPTAGTDLDVHPWYMQSSRRGDALDLAHPSSSLKPPGLYTSATVPATPLMRGSASGSTRSQHHTHHRGQSVVSPEDLQLHKASDNKRKRASWDGGIF